MTSALPCLVWLWKDIKRSKIAISISILALRCRLKVERSEKINIDVDSGKVDNVYFNRSRLIALLHFSCGELMISTCTRLEKCMDRRGRMLEKPCPDRSVRRGCPKSTCLRAAIGERFAGMLWTVSALSRERRMTAVVTMGFLQAAMSRVFRAGCDGQFLVVW